MDDISLTEMEREEALSKLKSMQGIQSEMGWRWFIAEINREIEILKNQLPVADETKDFYRLQGRHDAFQQIVNFEDVVDNLIDSYEAEEDA